jgi:hypothetical protein
MQAICVAGSESIVLAVNQDEPASRSFLLLHACCLLLLWLLVMLLVVFQHGLLDNSLFRDKLKESRKLTAAAASHHAV